LPAGVDGSLVVLISPDSSVKYRVSSDAYTVADGNVVFYTPPPTEWIVSFELPGEVVVPSVCTVIYPDGTLKQLSQDPYELLVLAQTERDEAKKLLKEAKNVVEVAERVVHVESEVAKEKLSARLDKYGTLVDESIRQAASAARDELRDYLGEMIEEVRTKHQEAVQARDLALTYKDLAQQSCLDAVMETEPKLTEHFQSIANHAIEAYTKTKELWNQTASFRDEVKSAAVNVSGDLYQKTMPIVNSVIDEVKSVRAAAQNEIQSLLAKANADVAAMMTDIRATRDATQAAAVRALEIERRCSEMDSAQAAREEGMRALWTRITGFKKTFDHRVSQMRGAAVIESGEGEEQA
jgi:hypothetical protein